MQKRNQMSLSVPVVPKFSALHSSPSCNAHCAWDDQLPLLQIVHSQNQKQTAAGQLRARSTPGEPLVPSLPPSKSSDSGYFSGDFDPRHPPSLGGITIGGFPTSPSLRLTSRELPRRTLTELERFKIIRPDSANSSSFLSSSSFDLYRKDFSKTTSDPR
ncbi:hypothetical protein M5K25_004415 [Dendrobium thyrsiflorum]|uniref:Uncharacterized protein n=1 Tax=Dendrobium thyrsiflorum TaxID=117978 RepID=A0ABD0VLL9_DENTH